MVFRSRSGWPGTPPSPPLAAAEVRELCPVRAHDFRASLACARHAVRAQPGNVSRSTGKDPHSLSGQTLTAVTQQYPLGRMPSGDQAGSGGLGVDPAGGPWPFVLAAAAGLLLALAGGCGGSSTRCPVRPATERSAV